MNDSLEIIAIMKPAQGKRKELEELLHSLAKSVEDNEPYARRYELFWVEKKEEYVFLEEYPNAELLKQHQVKPYLRDVFMKGEEEHLLAKPVEFRTLQRVGGFSR